LFAIPAGTSEERESLAFEAVLPAAVAELSQTPAIRTSATKTTTAHAAMPLETRQSPALSLSCPAPSLLGPSQAKLVLDRVHVLECRI
jgi:hypothetical protein